MFLGAYSFSEYNFIWWYIYPTYYHFVASIIVLYIPFFFIVKVQALRDRLVPIMVGLVVVWLVVYWTIYDRSYYHIDTVREPMIRFLFMESMLLGAWFRQNDKKLRGNFNPILPFIAVAAFGIYFTSKLLFSKRASLAPLQFLNQIAIFVFLILLFRTFSGLDGKLEKMPGWIKKVVCVCSDMTLEIYVVQYVIIAVIRNFGLFFPLNWIVLTACILLSAFILHKVCKLIYGAVDKALERK